MVLKLNGAVSNYESHMLTICEFAVMYTAI